MRRPLAQQALAEFLGTAGLVAVVVGSGIAAQRSSADSGLQLLENAIVTGAGLAALITAFGPISGADFNPVVTLVSRLRGGTTTAQLLAYLPAQVAGAVSGAIAANLMFGISAVDISTHRRSGGGRWLAEVLATFGLVLLVVSLSRAAHPAVAPFTVGAYIAAAYWWSSSTSFANPAVTVGRIFSDTFAGIAPSSAPMFILMQLVGAGLAAAAAAVLYPTEGVA